MPLFIYRNVHTVVSFSIDTRQFLSAMVIRPFLYSANYFYKNGMQKWPYEGNTAVCVVSCHHRRVAIKVFNAPPGPDIR